jgi:hypothetical protein
MSSDIGCDIRIYGYHSSKLSLARIQMIWNPNEVYSRYISRKHHVYSERRYISGIYHV